MSQLTPREFNEFERELASLKPTESSVQRDQLMFLAGQAAAGEKPSRPTTFWLWPTIASVSSVAALVLACLLVVQARNGKRRLAQPTPKDVPAAPTRVENGDTNANDENDAALAVDHRVPRSQSVDQVTPPPLVSPKADFNFLRMRQAVLAMGADGLPDPRYDEVTETKLVAASYWDESREVFRNPTIAAVDTMPSSLLIWAEMMQRGTNP